MNYDLVSLFQWLAWNKLKLNMQKTKYMVITFKKNVPVNLFKVKIGDTDLECVKHMNYLGVVIDDNLKFNKNMEMLQKINFIRRLSSKLSKYSKITLYKAIISPHLDYCSSILFLANNSELSYLQKLQNRMMRTILRSRLDTPIRNMLETLNFLSVRQRVTYNTMVLYKMEKNCFLTTCAPDCIELVAHILTTQGVAMTSCYRISGRRQPVNKKFLLCIMA
jgi:hypothetical protein